MNKHDRGGIRVSPAAGWVHLCVDSFAIAGVDVGLAWLHGRYEGAGGGVREDRRYTYTRGLKMRRSTDTLRILSCRADLRLGIVKSGWSPTTEYR